MKYLGKIVQSFGHQQQQRKKNPWREWCLENGITALRWCIDGHRMCKSSRLRSWRVLGRAQCTLSNVVRCRWSAVLKMRHQQSMCKKLVWKTEDRLTSASPDKFSKWMATPGIRHRIMFHAVSVRSDRSLVAVKSLSIKFVQFNRFQLNEWHSSCFWQTNRPIVQPAHRPAIENDKIYTCVAYGGYRNGQSPYTNHSFSAYGVWFMPNVNPSKRCCWICLHRANDTNLHVLTVYVCVCVYLVRSDNSIGTATNALMSVQFIWNWVAVIYRQLTANEIRSGVIFQFHIFFCSFFGNFAVVCTIVFVWSMACYASTVYIFGNQTFSVPHTARHNPKEEK